MRNFKKWSRKGGHYLKTENLGKLYMDVQNYSPAARFEHFNTIIKNYIERTLGKTSHVAHSERYYHKYCQYLSL